MHARILITGSRHLGIDDLTGQTLMYNTLVDVKHMLQDQGIRSITLVHGAERGTDCQAEFFGKNLGMETEAYPIDCEWDRDDEYLIRQRNQELVNLGADVVLAFPIGKSYKTRDCTIVLVDTTL